MKLMWGRRLRLPFLLLIAALLLPAAPQKDTEWPTYAADLAGSRYRPLDQIDASNFSRLEVAWRFKTDSIGNRPEFKLEGTPLMVNGVLYATAGSRRAAIALDAVTGELLWVHGEHEGPRGAAAPRQLSGRGLAYWTDGKQERILYVTPGYRLVALDARTGGLVPGFGVKGVVDLKLDMDQKIQPDLITGEVGLQSAPVVAGNTILIGAAFREGMTPKAMNNNKGYVRAYDVRTGRRLWIFHTIPLKGEFGYDTWLDGSAEHTGNTGLWTQMTVDEQLGLAYLPIESPTGDYYGGHRPGDDLFGESLVCVDLRTGKRKWHYQLVHHPLWDMDISSAPLLVDIKVNGQPLKAVAQPTKQGFLYVFHRVTGKPVWPIEEKPVEKGTVPGEWYSPTQPFPSKPAAYSRNGVTPDVLIDFTPALHDEALQLVSKYKLGPVFTPPVASELPGPLATLTIGTASGGTNWPGASFDPETHIVYVHACNACVTPIGVVPTPSKEISDMRYVMGTAGQEVRIARGPGENAGADSPLEKAPATPTPAPGRGGALTVQGLPLLKPPYSTISAISLDTGEIVWQVPDGETPDAVRNHPALKGLSIPRTGQSGYNIGTLVTKSLVIAGDGQVTTIADHPRGAMLRAYDKKTGKEAGAVWMPAPQSGSPMTYMVNGRQYIVVAVSGGNYSGEYIAFTLPEAQSAAPRQVSSLTGEQLYAQRCASCHGARLTGGESAPALAGSEFGSSWNDKPLTALTERIRTTMPAGAPGTLSREDSALIAQYIAQINRPAASNPPNPYRTIENYFKLPNGRQWGSTSAVFAAPNGHIWIAERCGANSCAGKNDPPVLEFDASGKLLKSFGSGIFTFPHGIFVDSAENVWIVDELGNQVVKFDVNGKVLMKLPGTFDEPNAVIVAPNGDIFVAEGHGIGTGGARIRKFSKDGKFIKQWGGHGSGPGQFEMPHALAFDSKGRLYVGDRGNDRIQVFDQDGKFIEAFTQFGRPSGIWIDKNDTLYVADSESREKEGYGHHPGWKRGIRIGSLRDGVVTAFIPDTFPTPEDASTSGAEGVSVDAAGNVYGAEVAQKGVKKYVRQP